MLLSVAFLLLLFKIVQLRGSKWAGPQLQRQKPETDSSKHKHFSKASAVKRGLLSLFFNLCGELGLQNQLRFQVSWLALAQLPCYVEKQLC